MKKVKIFNDFLEINANMLGLSRQEYVSRHLSENKNEEDGYDESYESNSAIFSDIASDFKQFVAEKKLALNESVVTESFVAYTVNSKDEYTEVAVLKDLRAAKAWRKKNTYLLDDESVDVVSIGTAPKKDWDKEHNESVVTESNVTPTMLLAQEIEGAEFRYGFGDGEEVEARSTKKTWPDGVPVLKYIARAPKKTVNMPEGDFEVVIDEKYGWIYWKDNGTWYGMDYEDNYTAFEH